MCSEPSDVELEKSGKSISFAALVLAPTACLIIGGLLIYYTQTPWQLGVKYAFLSTVWGITFAIATFAAVVFVTRLPLSYSLRNVCRQLLPIFKGMAFWKVVVLSLMAGIGEELLFRGFLQQWLDGFVSVSLAIGIAAVIFGVLHFASVSYFLLTAFLGAAFGIAYHLTDSLLLIMSWHAFYDLLAIWVFSRYPRLLGIEDV
jgi:membrane protease YdiL (CAAX protease family)